MWAIRVATLYTLCACLLAAQESATRPPHGLEILQLSWSKETLYRPPPHSSWNIPARVAPPQVLFTYTMKVKNVGAKAIQAVFWEYVTTDSISGTEIGRRQIINYQKVKPDAVVTLRVWNSAPPTILVTVKGSGEAARSTPRESAEIKCVLYADETVWQPADSSRADCEELRRVVNQMKAERKGRH